jgi:hypothetical protein
MPAHWGSPPITGLDQIAHLDMRRRQRLGNAAAYLPCIAVNDSPSRRSSRAKSRELPLLGGAMPA